MENIYRAKNDFKFSGTRYCVNDIFVVKKESIIIIGSDSYCDERNYSKEFHNEIERNSYTIMAKW